MNVKELNRNQLEELKQRYYTERNENVSYGELANIDNLVTDNEIFEFYKDVDFVEDDFFSNNYVNEDTEDILNSIDNKYKEIENRENTSNALDFINEIVDYLKEKYRI